MKHALRSAAAVAAILAIAGSAQAADMMDAPSGYWTGLYFGGQAGYYDAINDFIGPVDYDAGEGAAVGVYAGYNMQLNGNFVVGIEGDVNFGLGGEPPIISGLIYHTDGFGSIRGRLGYAVDATLLYATGGVAFASLDGLFGAPLIPGVDDVAVGFAAGGGVEHFIAPSISIKAEYLYMGFGDVLDPAVPNTDLDIHTVRAGVAFHF